MEQVQNHTETFESVWTEIQKNRRVLEDFDENEARFNRQISKMQTYRYYLGDDGFLYSDGFYTEEYFLTAFRHEKKTFFSEKFDDIDNHFNSINGNRYDLVMYSDFVVTILELSYKASEKDVVELLRKAETFRVDFPKYKNHKIYLSLASMSFYPTLEEECKKQGIAIIKQVGDTVVIHDEHLKAF